jgi:hypothetical protein
MHVQRHISRACVIDTYTLHRNMELMIYGDPRACMNACIIRAGTLNIPSNTSILDTREFSAFYSVGCGTYARIKDSYTALF